MASDIVIILLIVSISLNMLVIPNLVINKANNIALTDSLNNLLSNQQKLLSTAYLATSSNNLLIENQKQFIPAIPTIHHTLANIEHMVNQTTPILIKFGQLEIHNITSITPHHGG